MNDISSVHLPVYIRIVKNLSKFKQILVDFKEITSSSPYEIEDLSELTDKEKYQRANCEIIKKRRRLYNQTDAAKIYLTIYRMARDEYLLITVLDPSKMIGKRILKSCFDVISPDGIHCHLAKQEAPFVASRHFQNMLPKHDVEPAIDYNTDTIKVNGVRSEKVLNIPDKLQNVINENMLSPESTLQSQFAIIWGILMCNYLGRKQIITRIIHEGGLLRSYPMVMGLEEPFEIQYARLREEFRQADSNDSCTVDVLNSQLRYDFSGYCPLSYEFTHDHLYDDFIRKMDPDTSYISEPYEDINTPLIVRCDYIDKKIIMTYDYDEGFFASKSIEVFHDTMVNFLNKTFHCS